MPVGQYIAQGVNERRLAIAITGKVSGIVDSRAVIEKQPSSTLIKNHFILLTGDMRCTTDNNTVRKYPHPAAVLTGFEQKTICTAKLVAITHSCKCAMLGLQIDQT